MKIEISEDTIKDLKECIQEKVDYFRSRIIKCTEDDVDAVADILFSYEKSKEDFFRAVGKEHRIDPPLQGRGSSNIPLSE